MFQLSVQDIHPGEQAGNKERGHSANRRRVSAGGEWRAAMLTVCWRANSKPRPFLAMVLRFPMAQQTRAIRC